MSTGGFPLAIMHTGGVLLHSKRSSEAVQSDLELEATGNSWLKSSNNPLRNLQITLPSIGEKLDKYSRDSLDSDIYPKDLRCVCVCSNVCVSLLWNEISLQGSDIVFERFIINK